MRHFAYNQALSLAVVIMYIFTILRVLNVSERLSLLVVASLITVMSRRPPPPSIEGLYSLKVCVALYAIRKYFMGTHIQRILVECCLKH